MPKYEAVVFDLYDTLLFLKKRTNPYSKLFLELGLKKEDWFFAKQLSMTNSFPDLFSLAKRLNPSNKIDLAGYEKEVLDEIKSAELYPETLDVLEKLKQENVRIGLLSNLASPYKKPFYNLGLQNFIKSPVFSCDVGYQKPQKGSYESVLVKMNLLAEKLFMTGDKFQNDVEGPMSIGMNAVLLDREKTSPKIKSIRSLEGIFEYIL